MPISHDNNQINLSGTETGDALRGYLNSNNLGQVDGRTMIFDRDLNIAANSNFTDENASYSFNDAHRYEPQTNCVVNFTDVVLRYDGSPKNHSFNNSYTANWTRVTYIQGVDNGRSDFFNNGTYTFNFSNVTMVSYGDNDFLHFQSNATLENIIIVNAAGGLNFEPGSRVAGEQMVINNLQLFGVSAFNMPSGGVGGSLRTDGMFWDQLTWRVQNGNRNTNYIFVSPIKPDGWIGYDATDPNNFVREFYKHSLSVTDGFAPVEGARVILYRDDLQTIIYDETTDAAGAMPLQEVLTFETINGNGNDYGNFQLRIVKFGNVLGADVRALQDGDISESFLSPVNESITTDLATALAYPVITSTEEAHNRAEAALVSNFNAESSPYTSRQGLLWNTGDLDVRIDPAAIEPFEFVPDGASTSVTTVSYTDEDESRPLGNSTSLNGISTVNAVVSILFTTGANITTNQIIWESGATGVGTALVISGGRLEVYAGNNNNLYSTHIIDPETSYGATIVYDLTGDQIRLYVAENQVPTASDLVDTDAFTQGDWCGTDQTGVGAGSSGTVRGGKTGTFQGSIDSDLLAWGGTNNIEDSYTSETVTTPSGDIVEILLNTTSLTGEIQTTGNVIEVSPPSVITYSVVNDLVVLDASSPITVDGANIGNIVNNDADNNLVINLINGAAADTGNPGTGDGQVSILNTQNVTININFNGDNPSNYEWRIGEKSVTVGVLYDVELAGNEFETNFSITYNFNYLQDVPAILQIIADNYVEAQFEFDLLNRNQTFNVSVNPDPNL